MLNKKILAAAIATAFTINANAAIDLASATTQTKSYASETLGTVTAGKATVTNLTNLLDVTSPVGFTIATGQSKYVRVNLGNAAFGAAPTLAVAASGGGAAPTATIAQGGTADDVFVIFEVAAGPLAADSVGIADVLTLAAASYKVSSTLVSSVTYTLYETAGDAVNETGALFTDTSSMTSVASANTGDFSTSETLTATVASQFKKVLDDAGTATVFENSVGAIDADGLLATGTFYKADGNPVAIADISAVTQVVTFAGDFSVGAWTLAGAADCSGADVAALTLDTAKAVATSAAYATTTAAWLCVDNTAAKSALAKGSYSATLVTDKATNSIGTIIYDTTAISVPYLTTFSGYNQKVYLINSGGQAANYITTFVSEDGVTATGGTGATGTIPAGEMVTIKATDLTTIVGGTRTSATIEIEAEAGNIKATSQTVNLATKTTDTVVLAVK
jgi:hypothetical protein